MMRVLLCFLVAHFLRETYAGARKPPNGTWIRMGMLNELMHADRTPGCEFIPGLSSGQSRLCHLYHDHMNVVAQGAQQALVECKHQFQHMRWNCSLEDNVNVFGPVVQISSRETAFAYALASAGVTYSVARACKDSQLASCGCARGRRPKNLRKEWIWGGCGDNLEYGYKFTQKFVDVRDRERKYRKGSREQGRSLMNLHNNEAGRRAVIKKSKVTCKCHGVSGSCSLITCWQQLPAFREIGNYLREKYDGATDVQVNRRGRLQVKDMQIRVPTASDLVYLDESPDYCVRNENVGILGTSGRVCNRTSHGLDGCKLLCCGRGYNTIKTTVKERCQCTFKWCCEVKCKTCIKPVDVHTCK